MKHWSSLNCKWQHQIIHSFRSRKWDFAVQARYLCIFIFRIILWLLAQHSLWIVQSSIITALRKNKNILRAVQDNLKTPYCLLINSLKSNIKFPNQSRQKLWQWRRWVYNIYQWSRAEIHWFLRWKVQFSKLAETCNLVIHKMIRWIGKLWR